MSSEYFMSEIIKKQRDSLYEEVVSPDITPHILIIMSVLRGLWASGVSGLRIATTGYLGHY